MVSRHNFVFFSFPNSEKMDVDDRFSPPAEGFHLPGKSGFGKWERGRRRYSHDRGIVDLYDVIKSPFFILAKIVLKLNF